MQLTKTELLVNFKRFELIPVNWYHIFSKMCTSKDISIMGNAFSLDNSMFHHLVTGEIPIIQSQIFPMEAISWV